MIDIHSHILFNIDDGAETLEDSVKLCRDAADNGVKLITATPHFFDYSHIRSFVSERNHKISVLREILDEEDIPISVAAGSELFLNDKVFSAGDLDALTINGSRYMLCEFPLGPFDIDRAPLWIDELISRGYTPIVAHPERYIEFHRNLYIIDELLDREVVFQVNIDSLTGKNGEEPQKMAIDMVMRKIALLIGSDAHDTEYRHTRLREKFKDLPEFIDERILLDCMDKNAKAILKNEEI